MRSKSDKKKSLVPRLRFPEFREAGAWEVKRLGEVCDVLDNLRKPVARTKRNPGPYPYYGASGAIDYIDQYIFDERLLLIGEDGAKWLPYEKTAFIVEGQYWVNNHAHVLRPTLAIDTLLENYLTALDISQHITGAAPPKLTLDNLRLIWVPLPPKWDEQQKIAHCLSSLDEVMGLQAKKVQALKQHKKGLMQQLFPAEGETTPRLRFPEFREAVAWEVKELIKLAGRGTERNQKGKIKRVLTNSAEHGVLDQREYFDKDIAIQGNLENYFVVDQGDFVYNPRISSFAPVGPISRNDVGKGVMSPLYTVFSFRQSDTDFFAHYFNSSAWHSYMRKVGSTGARHDRMAISNSDFLAMPLSVPNPKEQQKIAHCLSSLDEVIGLESHKLDALKNLKKGLMQQLFPQEVA